MLAGHLVNKEEEWRLLVLGSPNPLPVNCGGEGGGEIHSPTLDKYSWLNLKNTACDQLVLLPPIRPLNCRGEEWDKRINHPALYQLFKTFDISYEYMSGKNNSCRDQFDGQSWEIQHIFKSKTQFKNFCASFQEEWVREWSGVSCGLGMWPGPRAAAHSLPFIIRFPHTPLLSTNNCD